MNTALRTLLATGAATLAAAAGSGIGTSHAAQAIQVTPGSYCDMGNDTGGIFFQIDNAQGLEYRLVMTHDGSEVVDDTVTLQDQSFQASGMIAAYGTMIEATLTINGQGYHYGPITLSEVDGACTETPGVHDIHASVAYLCIDGEPTINLTVENDGDYLEPLSGMFVDESFDTELGAGAATNGQKVVAVGAPYEFSVMSGQTTLVEDEGTMPDVCAIPHSQGSAGQLPETGSGHTLTVVLAGLLLTFGAGLVRLTLRRRQLVWVETPQATDTV